jgi:predicted alpha/beta-hydrolase family hydrolase
LRVKHLESLQTPTLIVQGERDQFGSREEVEKYKLSPRIRIEWIEHGDHSYKPPARSGRTLAENISDAISVVSEFAKTL